MPTNCQNIALSITPFSQDLEDKLGLYFEEYKRVA